jgi:hypothetical protein
VRAIGDVLPVAFALPRQGSCGLHRGKRPRDARLPVAIG